MDKYLQINNGQIPVTVSIESVGNPIIIQFNTEWDLSKNWDITFMKLCYIHDSIVEIRTERDNEIGMDSPIYKQLINLAMPYISKIEIDRLSETEIKQIEQFSIDGFSRKSILILEEKTEENYIQNYKDKDYAVRFVRKNISLNNDEWAITNIQRAYKL
jgi:hypothetical protein